MHHCRSRQERGEAKSLAKYPFDQRILSESRELREQQEEGARHGSCSEGCRCCGRITDIDFESGRGLPGVKRGEGGVNGCVSSRQVHRGCARCGSGSHRFKLSDEVAGVVWEGSELDVYG